MEKKITYEISWTSIFRIIAVGIALLIFFYLYDVFLILFTVVILVSALTPVVAYLSRKLKIGRIWSITIIFAILVLLIGTTIYLIVPVFFEQLQTLLQRLPDYIGKFGFLKNFDGNAANSIQSVSGAISGVAKTFFESASNAFSGLATIFVILIMTLFLLLEENGMQKFVISILPISQKNYILEITNKISQKMGHWLIAQIALMFLMGLINGLALWAVGVPYALILGILSGILEIIPIVGPIIAAIPAALIAYIAAPWKAVFVVVFALIMHQLSNQFLVPKFMQKAIGSTPFVIIMALLIGDKLGGMIGAIIAVPVLAVFQVVSAEWPNIRKRI
ncbi:MAG TPA: AI-2E family transporter [Patescibacteria group bacterium]|nr:AI-2E family transporter [Patescibacteria group bacterium]